MKTSVVTVPAKRRQVSRLLGNFIRARVVLAHLAAAFVLPFNIAQADQLTMLTAFGLPRSASPSQLVNVNGLLFFVVNMDYSGGELWRSDGTTADTFPVKKGMPSSNGASCRTWSF
jgi:ELWxxDGT repeat protein